MKTNIQVKEEPVELQNYSNETVNKLLQIYGYNLTNHQPESGTKFKGNPITIDNTSRAKSIVNHEQEPSTCAWCQKLGFRSFTLRTDNGDSKALCSEVCFNQFRRASFKKNKGSESDLDHRTAAIPTKNHSQTAKSKSSICPVVSEKKLKMTLGTNGHTTNKRESSERLIENNRRKLVLPIRRSTTTVNEATRKLPPPSPASPPSKRHRSSSSSSFSLPLTLPVRSPTPNLPVGLAWPPSLLVPPSIVWPPTVDMGRFQYPFFAPPPPPSSSRPCLLPLPTPEPSGEHLPTSTLFTSLAKGVSSNITCILPSFIPLPIPIPIPLFFPVHLPCVKCSVDVIDQTCQTELDCFSSLEKRTRRMSV